MDEDQSYGIQLLCDIHDLFTQKGADRLSSEVIATALADKEDRPWSEWGRQKKKLTKTQLARLLKPFNIRPTTVRIDGKTPKGYLLDDFMDAFRRYLPDNQSLIPPFQNATPQQALFDNKLRQNQIATREADAAVKNGHKSLPVNNVADVADWKGDTEALSHGDWDTGGPDERETAPATMSETKATGSGEGHQDRDEERAEVIL